MVKYFESSFTQHYPGAPPTPATASYLADGAVEVVVTRLDLEPDALEPLADLLRDEERQRSCRFHFERDRRRFIVARGRLRQLLAARLSTHPRSVEFSYGARGKPVVAQGSAGMDWRFNVSHSRDIAVFAFCRGREVGIDVEAVHFVHDADAIAAQCFSPGELGAYSDFAPRDKEMGFFNCWTRHEAVIKARGEGLRYPLRMDVDGDDSGWCLRSFSPVPGYVAALAVEHRGNAQR